MFDLVHSSEILQVIAAGPPAPTAPTFEPSKAGPHLTFKHSPLLRTIRIGIYIECCLSPPRRDVVKWQNDYVWGPALRVLLAARFATLHHIRFDISLVYDMKAEHLDFYLPLQELDWADLRRVVQRHPCLQTLELCFPCGAPSFADARQAVLERLPDEVRDLVRFSQSPNVACYEY